MSKVRTALVLFLLSAACIAAEPAASTGACSQTGSLTRAKFEAVMRQVADGWNNNNAKLAAECFAENAIYSAPPGSGHQGRKALFEYFGGTHGRPQPMRMQWHHLVFDPEQQIGAGEYTFRYRIQTHGMVIVRLDHGRISHWREYEVESGLPWEDFVGANRF